MASQSGLEVGGNQNSQSPLLAIHEPNGWGVDKAEREQNAYHKKFVGNDARYTVLNLFLYIDTVQRRILRTPILYAHFALFGILRYVWSYHEDFSDKYFPKPTNDMLPPGAAGLAAFASVFYLNYALSRHWDLYHKGQGLRGNIFDCLILARGSMSSSIVDISVKHTPEKTELEKKLLLKLHGYLLTFMVSSYCGLGTKYDLKTFVCPFVQEENLLLEKEFEVFQSIADTDPGAASRESLIWASQTISEMQRKELFGFEVAIQCKGFITNLRDAAAKVKNTMDLPIPYTALHFLWVLLYAITFLKTCDLAKDQDTATVMGGMAVLFMYCQWHGMFLIAAELEDPFGDDIDDFDVRDYLLATAKGSAKLVEMH